jgi:hypothetical protein
MFLRAQIAELGGELAAQSLWVIVDVDLAVEIVGQHVLDQQRAEAPPFRFDHRGSVALHPREMKIVFVFARFDVPTDRDFATRP